MKDFSIVVINWNQCRAVGLLLKSFVAHHYEGEPFKLFLLDNASTDESEAVFNKNNIPYFRSSENMGHENGVNLLYPFIQTQYTLLLDSDVEFTGNIFPYFDYLKNDCISAGELIDKNYMWDKKIRDRISPWFWLWDIKKMKAAGVNIFRDPKCEDWSYDVGSWYTEKMFDCRYTNYNIERLPGDQDVDLISMKYPLYNHIGKVSWDENEHLDRVDEIYRRRIYIEKRLEDFKHIDLRGKFEGGFI